MASRPRYDDIDLSQFQSTSSVHTRGRRVEADLGQAKRAIWSTKVHLKPSEWVSHFVRIKDGDTGTVKPVEFSERRYLRRIYDTPARKVILFTSRQTEKSTTVGNILMAKSGMRPMYTSLFVTPSAMQTTVFSKSRLDDIIEISPLIKALTHQTLTMNILEKEFVTRSRVYLRYAFLNADRIRGLSVNAVFGDEIQDLLQDVMPVIEETASHHKDPFFLYSGTPKTFDNTIEHYFTNASTQNEWCIPCEHHGTPNNPASWHWNVLGVKNLGLHGPICDRCGRLLNPEHPFAQWVQMNPGAPWEGYRICRLMVPWFFKNPEKWQSILEAHRLYPTAQFMNEVMALSFDSGVKPLSRAEVIRACDPTYTMDEEAVAALGASTPLYAGIDWGTGEGAYSVMTVGGYVRGDVGFQILFSKRFDGPLVEPEAQLEDIKRLVRKFNVKYIGADYGMGFHPNKMLTSVFGPKRVHQFQYAARSTAKVTYKPALHRYIVFRTPVMSDVFNAIKTCKIRFPRWEEYEKPYASDMLAIRSEYSDSMKMIKYDKPRGLTDDTFHSVLYCLLASMFDVKRPDIIAPIRETGDQAARSAVEEQALEEAIYLAQDHPDY